jgi:hypothetical protein
MEQFFDLHNVPHTQKVQIASLYLEPNQFVWYRWICSRKSLITWTIFTEEMIAHYEDTRSNTFFSQLINLKQKGSVTEHIENFQRLNIKVTNIPDEHLIDVFIGTLKDNIQHEVRLWEPKSLENAFKVARNVESKNMAMATRRTNPNIYRENNAPSSKTPQPTRLTPQQLEERKEKGLCFNCDNKYSKGHKCGEKKLFYIDCEEEEEQEQEPSQDENVEAILSEELNPMISCNALAGISTPQTLKIEGYIKKKKVIVLIDSGNTHNFIHYKLAKDLNCFVYLAPEFQVMIVDGGTINCSGKCNKINLTMGEYVMKPKSKGKSVIIVIVDRLTKYTHFCALSHPFKASTVATTFMETVQKLHGNPKILVSDRDPIFTGHFWTALFSCLDTQLAHISSYHPHSDGKNQYSEQMSGRIPSLLCL